MTKQEKSKLVKQLAESICALYEEADKAETCPDCGNGEKTQPAEPPKENLGEADASGINFDKITIGDTDKTVSDFKSVSDFLAAVYECSQEAGKSGYESLQIDFYLSPDKDDTYDVSILSVN